MTAALQAPVQASLACWPGLTHMQAAELAMQGAREPWIGPIGTDHVQLVPQGFDVLTEELVDALKSRWPATRWRLHANVRVLPRRRLADLCTFERDRDWFEAAARVQQQLGGPAYSAHAGRRVDADMGELLDNARRCADLFGCPVAIEGQYPVRGDKPHQHLLSTWAEYAQLLESGVPFALDLSHLHILATYTGQREISLITEMLASEACLEVHLSDNDGRGDWHRVVDLAPWWSELLSHINPGAVVFTEGNRLRRNPLKEILHEKQ